MSTQQTLPFDPYKVLGLGRNATQEEIQAQFQKLYVECDPVTGSGLRTEEENRRISAPVTEIVRAYTILRNDRTRKDYDNGRPYRPNQPTDEDSPSPATARGAANHTQGSNAAPPTASEKPAGRPLNPSEEEARHLAGIFLLLYNYSRNPNPPKSLKDEEQYKNQIIAILKNNGTKVRFKIANIGNPGYDVTISREPSLPVKHPSLGGFYFVDGGYNKGVRGAYTLPQVLNLYVQQLQYQKTQLRALDDLAVAILDNGLKL